MKISFIHTEDEDIGVLPSVVTYIPDVIVSHLRRGCS